MVEELADVKSCLEKVRRKVEQCRMEHCPELATNYEKVRKEQISDKLSRKTEKKAHPANKKEAFRIVGENESRLASETILKNRGLMKRRRKTDGNSRLKLRKRFEKAKSKQRAMGHFVRENPGRQY